MIFIIAIRGATTCTANTRESIVEASAELVRAMIESNNIAHDEFVSIIFTATPDLNAAFPAEAARLLGLVDVPLLGAQELNVMGALGRCVRVLIHANKHLPRHKVRHVYLHGAKALRPDLAQEGGLGD